MTTIKLFCFPYAGGSASVFGKWHQYLSAKSNIELIPVELAGRGKRIHEPLFDDLQDAVADLYRQNSREMARSPYAFFGHSLGGLLAYELAQKIKETNTRQPVHLFFSGRSAPDVADTKEKKYALMDDEEFKEEVLKIGGTSREVFEHPELTNLFMPLLRSDFKLADTDITQREMDPFDCDITVLSGKEDHRITPEQIDAWKGHTKGCCVIRYFNGGHLFLRDEAPGIVTLIENTLREQLQ